MDNLQLCQELMNLQREYAQAYFEALLGIGAVATVEAVLIFYMYKSC